MSGDVVGCSFDVIVMMDFDDFSGVKGQVSTGFLLIFSPQTEYLNISSPPP